MSKDKIAKNKLKKLDLFSIMMEQSAIFRDMVSSFQGSFGFQSEPLARLTSAPPVSTLAEPTKHKKAKKGASTAAKAKRASKSAKRAATPASKKAKPEAKATQPAARKTATKVAKKAASKTGSTA